MFVVLFTTFLLAAFFLSAREEDKEEAQTSKSFRSKIASILRILAVILDDDDDDDDEMKRKRPPFYLYSSRIFVIFVRLFVLNLDFQTAHICRETTSNFCFKRGNPLIVCKRAVCDAETSHYTEPDFVHHLCERNRDFE